MTYLTIYFSGLFFFAITLAAYDKARERKGYETIIGQEPGSAVAYLLAAMFWPVVLLYGIFYFLFNLLSTMLSKLL